MKYVRRKGREGVTEGGIVEGKSEREEWKRRDGGKKKKDDGVEGG